MRKEAERLGLRVGKKIKNIRRKVNGEDNDYISKGKVEGLYPHIFTVRMEAAEGFIMLQTSEKEFILGFIKGMVAQKELTKVRDKIA